MPPIGSWCRYEVEGEWDATNSGGCFNFPEWRKNPQFEIRTRESTDAVFLLMQRDPRTAVSLGAPQGGGGGMGADASEKKGGDDGGPSYDCKIGMYVMRGHETYRRKVLYDSEEMEVRCIPACAASPHFLINLHSSPPRPSPPRFFTAFPSFASVPLPFLPRSGRGGRRLHPLHGLPRGHLQHI